MSNRITMGLLFAIGIVFVLQMAIPGLTGALDFDPTVAFSQPWRFITCMFLHANLEHIFFNALALFMFGLVLENRVSETNYLIIYFVGGIIGSLLYYFTCVIGLIPMVPALGASGAIYGILGAVAIIEPNLRIFLFGIVPMRMREAAILWFVIEFLGTMGTYSSGIANAAHLGGLIFGIVYAYALKKAITEPTFHQKYDWEY